MCSTHKHSRKAQQKLYKAQNRPPPLLQWHGQSLQSDQIIVEICHCTKQMPTFGHVPAWMCALFCMYMCAHARVCVCVRQCGCVCITLRGALQTGTAWVYVCDSVCMTRGIDGFWVGLLTLDTWSGCNQQLWHLRRTPTTWCLWRPWSMLERSWSMLECASWSW